MDLPIEFSGTGPGARTRDGCSVELYRRQAYAGEIEHLRAQLPPGARVLELGCGTGLLTHRLLDFGCVVTGVDNSAEMLAHVSPRVCRVQSDIETLRLHERFDVVLLPSGLVNHADAHARSAFLATAACHVAAGGELILKRQDDAWLRAAQPGPLVAAGHLSMAVDHVERQRDLVSMTLRYGLDGETWTHAFTVAPLCESDVAALLQDAGFAPPRALDERRLWLAAGLATPP
jgi:SAM-dependent methyltransferase